MENILLLHLITTKTLGDFGAVMGAIPPLPAFPKPLLLPSQSELELEAAPQYVLLLCDQTYSTCHLPGGSLDSPIFRLINQK